MQALKSRTDFLESLEGQDILRKLRVMSADTAYNTTASYTADSGSYPNNQMPFVDKHMNYLIAHPKLHAGTYLTNLRLMTRVR